MFKRILAITIALSLVFILGCSEISGITHTSLAANPQIAMKSGGIPKQPVNTVTSSSTPLADLVIESITRSPANPSIGEKVTFIVSIKNQGSAIASSSTVAYYIDDAYLISASVSSLGPGATDTRNFTWVAQPGSHTIKAVADFKGKVTESDETNNENTVILQTLAPDLIISAITWSPENPSKEDATTFTVTIANQGSGQAGFSRVHFYIDGVARGYHDIQQIGAGATGNTTFNWTAQEGSHAIKAIVDKDNWVTESDDGNNEKTVPFLTLPPDLIIPDITWSPENPAQSENVTITIFIENQGDGRASHSWLACYRNDRLLTSILMDPIDAGATDNETFYWIASPGLRVIKAVADSKKNVIEIDETNNEMTVILSLLPDLIVEDITWSPETPLIGDEVTFSVNTKNQGNAEAKSSRVYFYVDDSAKGCETILEIGAGDNVTKAFTWTAQEGSHTIKAIADKESKVTESDETNNEKTATFSPITPDLIIGAITWLPANPMESDNMTFTVVIENQGSSEADQSSVACYIDDVYLASASVNSVNATATDNKTFNWIAQVGTHVFKVVADSEEALAESDETNNEMTVTLPTLAPDLTVHDIVWVSANLSVGDKVTFIATIQNRGNAKAENYGLAYYVDDVFLTSAQVNLLGPRATDNQTFTWIAQAGSHPVKAVVDYDEKIVEGDEKNNDKTIVFPTPTPDLIIQAIDWSPEKPAESNNVSFNVTIENQGTGRADYSRVHLYIDGESQGYRGIQRINANDTVTEVFTWTAEAGSHMVEAVADGADYLPEANEFNNEKAIALQILSASASTQAPGTKPPGDSAGKSSPIPSLGKGIWLDLLFLLVLIALFLILIMAIRRSRKP